MKTSKRLAQDVMDKITYQAERKRLIRKSVGQVLATAGVFVLLIPTAFYVFQRKDEKTSPTPPPQTQAPFDESMDGIEKQELTP